MIESLKQIGIILSCTAIGLLVAATLVLFGEWVFTKGPSWLKAILAALLFIFFVGSIGTAIYQAQDISNESLEPGQYQGTGNRFTN